MPEVTSNEERARKIVVAHLGVEAEKVTTDAEFVDDLGADSLDMVELTMAFEEEFNIDITDEAAEKVVTFKDALNIIDKERPDGHR